MAWLDWWVAACDLEFYLEESRGRLGKVSSVRFMTLSAVWLQEKRALL